MGDQSRQNTAFFLNENLLETTLPGEANKTLLIRTYPKTTSRRASVTPQDGDDVSRGSGFFVSGTGHLLTNHHVIKGATNIRIKLNDGRSCEANVIRSAPSTDLALLKCDLLTPNFLSIAPTSSVRLGDAVFTIGFPVSDLLGTSAKFTDGSVSSMSGLQNDDVLMQVTVPIQPGSSGGPLLSKASGDVVGIMTSTAAVEAFYQLTGSLPQNVNWAVKADYARLLLEGVPLQSQASVRRRAVDELAQSVALVETTR